MRILFLSILFFTMTLHASSETDLRCEDYAQTNSVDALWTCPALVSNGSLYANLADVDFYNGTYRCSYHYVDTGQHASECDYVSMMYISELNISLHDVARDVNATVRGSPYAPLVHNFNSPFYKIPSLVDMSPIMGAREQDIAMESLYDRVNTGLRDLHNHAYQVKNADNSLYKLAGIVGGIPTVSYGISAQKLNKAQKDSYDQLVHPYVSGGTREEDTFSKFVTGMVTLDPDVVAGYDETNGSLKISSRWNLTRSSGTFFSFNYDSAKKKISAKMHSIDLEKDNIKDWIDIFRQKIWGFYYNLQRRFDIGYDIISTQLLFIMLVFFAIATATRGGARYITNREQGNSSGEIKINEASIMKTLGILATVFIFFISIPSPMVSTYVSTNKTEIPNEMKGNSSLIKMFIRYAMEKGSDFGTMMADLGTDAFLDFLIQKQGLNDGRYSQGSITKSIQEILYYYPAVQIANECRDITRRSDSTLMSGNYSVSIHPYYDKTKTSFLPGNHIEGISRELCAKTVSYTLGVRQRVNHDIEELIYLISVDLPVRMTATANMVTNHLLLQKELGWMNITTVPFTYFMLKNNKLFFEPSQNLDDIRETTNDMMENLGVRGTKDTLAETPWIKSRSATQSRVDTAAGTASNSRETYTRLAVYNFLPQFSTIRSEVMSRLQSLYSDTLRVKRITQVKNGNNQGGISADSKLIDFIVNTLLANAYRYSGSNFMTEEDQVIFSKIVQAVDENNTIEIHKIFYLISYIVAFAIWNSGFILIFLAAIAMIIGQKIVLYVINVLIHFFISPFIVLWTFAAAADGGIAKVKQYLRDTLIYMLYPTLIVISVFIFIFAYELFYSVYGFILSVLIESQVDQVGQAIIAAGELEPSDAAMSYLAIYALRDITHILIDLLSVYVAIMTINKFPELVLKLMGIHDSAVIMLGQAGETLQGKGGGSVNPLSR